MKKIFGLFILAILANTISYIYGYGCFEYGMDYEDFNGYCQCRA